MKLLKKLPLLMLDTSNPGNSKLPKGYSAVAGYIGGDTGHVWTPEQWANFRGVPKLPIYVDDFKTGRAAGESDGWDCVQKLYALGVTRGSVVAYDIEVSKDAQRAYGFTSVLNYCGFVVWLYGSRSTLLTIPFSDYWVADYLIPARPHWPVRAARSCQFAANVSVDGISWDVSCIRLWQIRSRKLWR